MAPWRQRCGGRKRLDLSSDVTWIAQGSTANLRFKTRFRAIINANGELTAFDFEDVNPCEG
jgi:hypothetical protein